jgi:hypothetical protein
MSILSRRYTRIIMLEIVKLLFIVIAVSIIALNVVNYASRTTNISLDSNERKTLRKLVDIPLPTPSSSPPNPSEHLTKKSGYCYVGTDHKSRQCINVGPNDLCQSKQIFPTLDVCINPSLRV